MSTIVKQYRKKPVSISAAIWDGEDATAQYILDWVGPAAKQRGHYIEIATLKGTMTASIGDYIIKDSNGKFYPCKPDVFADCYELEV